MAEDDDFPDLKREDEERAKLSNFTVPMALERAHEFFIKDLTAKAIAGTLSKEDKVVLRNILKDNGMTLGLKVPGLPAVERPLELPDLEDGEL